MKDFCTFSSTTLNFEPGTLNPSADVLEDFAASLRPRLTGELRLDAMTRALYATDASVCQIQPVGVLLPKHVDDVQAAMEAAARYQIPVLPRGGGSSLAGQTVGEALVIDFTGHLDAILEVIASRRSSPASRGRSDAAKSSRTSANGMRG